MSEMDLIISGGTLVTAERIFKADVGVTEGRISAIGETGSMSSAKESIGATGQHVFPGIVDPHMHLQTFANPFDENLRTESKSAAVGGVTTIIPTLLNREDPTVSFFDNFPYYREAIEKYSTIDVGFSAVMGTDQHVDDLDRMARELGICSFKFYMAYTQDEAIVFGINAMNDKQIIEGLRNLKEIGYPSMMMVHAENMSIIHGLKAKYIAEGRNDLKAWTDARPDIAEEEATRRAIFYAEETGSRLYIVHMTIGRGVQWVREAQARGVNVIAETCPHYLVLTKFDHDKVGHLGKVNPPLRDDQNQEALWGGIRDGVVTCVGSDHSTVVMKPDKVKDDIWTAVPGFPGSGMLLPIMLSEGYRKGRASLEQICAVLSTNNARTYGLWPKKGAIEIGSDADFAIVDLDEKRVVTPEYSQSYSDWGLYDGWELQGWPTRTIVRGRTVVDHGEVVGEEGYGVYLPRHPVN